MKTIHDIINRKREVEQIACGGRIANPLWVGIPAIIVMIWIICGCASTRVVTSPSTKPLQEDLGRAQTHITESKTLAQRIHDKDILIDRWNATHHK